ncbi:hypothetical protein Adt_35061 [Abeliophyllum distichum]|uniref:Uncharacterized protein n=1 Tax=Abeliophyllum distichum TaxID=126358 RepID=A0ABD1QDN3_9LAMI
MAPKRKDPPAKKGKEKIGSLSSRRQLVETDVDDGDILRFWGFEEEHIYNKWLIKKNLWAEREVILSDFPFSEMANLINSYDWERVVGKRHLVYPLLVKEFLATLITPLKNLSRPSCASGRSSMFSCFISTLCLAEGVPLLPDEEPETSEPPINKQTLGNHMARRASDNPTPIPSC